LIGKACPGKKHSKSPPEQILMQHEQEQPSKMRPYLYELDRLRVVTVFSVIAVHVLAKTTFLDTSLFALQIQNGLVTAFHFTREMFMFVTAFALVHVYYGKPFALGRFWKRRGLGVVLPYVIWSAIYIWITLPPQTPLNFLHILCWDVITGNASYQLYYILLTIQFYLFFPCFLVLLRRIQCHPWMTLAASFLLEIIILYIISNYLQNAALSGNAGLIINLLQDRFVLVYQFYFVLGAMAALYLQQMRNIVIRYHKWILGSIVAAFIALELHYALAITLQQISISDATAVLQPIMAFYSTAVIAFLYWQAYCWAIRAAQTNSQKSRHLWQTLSHASFGIYIVHPLFLTPLLTLTAQLSAWPAILLVILTWATTAAASITFCMLLLNIPLLSRLVGREMPIAPLVTPSRSKKARHAVINLENWLPFRAFMRRKDQG
jgi:surface polysaccharide O-acyltransferase-like enzyme